MILDFIISILIVLCSFQYLLIIIEVIKAWKKHKLKFSNVSYWAYIPCGLFYLWMNESDIWRLPNDTRALNNIKEKLSWAKKNNKDYEVQKFIEDLRERLERYWHYI